MDTPIFDQTDARTQPVFAGGFLLVATLAWLFSVALSPIAFAQDTNANRPVTRLSPQIRELPLSSSVNAIQRATIEKFLTGNRIVDPEIFENAPYILSSTSNNLIFGAGDEVFLRGDWESNLRAYDIYRPGNTYEDPATEELLGMEVIHLGSIDVIAELDDGVRRGVIRNNRMELKAGDRLLPRESSDLQHTFLPRDPVAEINAVIIGLLGDKSLVAQYDAVVINAGERDGLQVGDMLGIYQAGGVIRDPFTNKDVSVLGNQTGELMVYRNFEKLSYGLILNATQPTSMNFMVRGQNRGR